MVSKKRKAMKLNLLFESCLKINFYETQMFCSVLGCVLSIEHRCSMVVSLLFNKIIYIWVLIKIPKDRLRYKNGRIGFQF